MTFPDRLVALRKEAGFDTRKDFAEAIRATHLTNTIPGQAI